MVITNYHAFRKRETMEAPKLTEEVLGGREGPVVTLESDGQMIRRVCQPLLGRAGRIMVLNDEAHHCYRERESARAERLSAEERGEVKRGKEMARLWISGLEALQRVVKAPVQVCDLSATLGVSRGRAVSAGGFGFQFDRCDRKRDREGAAGAGAGRTGCG